MPQKLTRLDLNRATLARQLLLERSPMDGVAAVEHLVGLQTQHPQSFYVGLWSRLQDFDPVAVGAALEDRRLVRIPLMRTTIHLVTAEDALGLRPLFDPVLDRVVRGQFGSRLKYLFHRDESDYTQFAPEAEDVAAAAREFVEQEPLIASELGRALLTRFGGDADAAALAQGARAWLPMVQVPPRGVWGRSGRARQAPLDTWLGRTPKAFPVDDVVLRYLGAFGPATVRDAQTWSGLTHLAEVFERLGDRLVRFVNEHGNDVYDLPEAPRPGFGARPPVRFLYDYDNVLLSHYNRERFLGDMELDDFALQGYSTDGNRQPSSVLIDGFVAGTWTAHRTRAAAALEVRLFRPCADDVRAEITAEGTGLLSFLHPGATPSVVVTWRGDGPEGWRAVSPL